MRFSMLSRHLIALASQVSAAQASCRKLPGDRHWPSPQTWAALNSSIAGKLLQPSPVASPCYPLAENAASPACAEVVANFNNSDFQSQWPLGHAFPYTQRVYCDLPGGNTTTCALGDEPVYAINASSATDIVAGVRFARENNIRLVVRETGHDLMGRTRGAGSLEVWLRHLRGGIAFEPSYLPTATCKDRSAWTGAAVNIQGAYKWADIYQVTKANNVIVVGGGSPDVGVTGYTLGGGHSPASSQFGLGADQLLEANVVLANGSHVLASACSNPDLFQSLRGGGSGYGVVTSLKIKAYPDATVSMMSLSITGLASGNVSSFLDAVSDTYQSIPSLMDGGLSGYGQWLVYGASSPTLSLYLGGFNLTTAQLQSMVSPLAEKLNKYNGTTVSAIITIPPTFPTYADYYSVVNSGVITSLFGGSLSSRLLGKKHLTDATGLREMLETLAGLPEETTSVQMIMTAANAVLHSPDRYSGLNPAWRETYMANFVSRMWLTTADYATTQAVQHDVTYVKGLAMAKLAPETGGYMNEGDQNDPKYLQNFYGRALPIHEKTKAKYDPDGLFYCNICVGSNSWYQDADGRLCRVQS